MSVPVLTIAIPTYNRPDELARTLSVILPQLKNDDRVYLLIIDNHSKKSASAVLESLSMEVPEGQIQVLRNNINIGGNANIMRCFEMCETEWIWVLGDDDAPSPDALKVILRDVQMGHSFGFYAVPQIQKPVFKENEPARVFGDDFKTLIFRYGSSKLEISFLSAAVLNMNAIRPYIIDGYLSANTGLPHLVMVFKALSAGSKWMISRDVIADYCPPQEGKGWGFMTFVFTTPTLLGLAASCAEVREIKDIMVKGWRPSPKKILYSLVSKYGSDPRAVADMYYLFKMAKHIYAPSWREDLMLCLRWNITSVLVFFPNRFLEKYQKKKEGKARINLDNETRR